LESEGLASKIFLVTMRWLNRFLFVDRNERMAICEAGPIGRDRSQQPFDGEIVWRW
jgi:hypothetical protein